MIPTTEQELKENKQAVHSAVDQVDIKEEVHPSDLIGSALKDFFNKGGSSAFAHVFSKFADVKSTFGKWIMEVQKSNKKGMPLTHGGEQIASLKTHNLQSCLRKNNLGVTLSINDPTYTLSIPSSANYSSISFTKENFAPFEIFLSDLCYLVEYSNIHYNDWRSSLLIHHLESFISIAHSQYKDEFMKILYNTIEKVRVNIAKAYGEKNISIMVSKFVQAASGSVPMLGNGRILAEQADDGEEPKHKAKASNESDFAHSIQVNFGIFFLFLIMYVCVYLYRMEVYKDSLIYSRFITTRKDKKA